MDAYYTLGKLLICLGLVFFLCVLGLKFIKSLRRNVYHKMKVSIHENEAHPTNGELVESEDKAGPDIIIVGAGVAGAALAYALGKDERRVHVIERDLSEPNRMVGEVLQPGGYLKLKDLGLQDCVENIGAQRMLGYAVFLDEKSAKLPYYKRLASDDAAGRSFRNGRFIQRMRHKAATLPNVQLTQGTVTSLLEENGTIKGVQYKTKMGQELIKEYAPLSIVCDGCFSNLRRSLCSAKVDILSSFVGLVLENCQLPFENYGHVILANPSPIVFYSIGANEVRCLVDVPGHEKLPSIANGEMAKYLKINVAPQVPHELHDAFIYAVDKGNIRTMRNGSMPATPCTKPGALVVGDSFNMRHALTGGGMTVALSDIVLLRNILRNSRDLKDTDILRLFYTSRKPMAFTMNTVAGVAYKLSCASADQERKEMHEAMFGYLKIVGGFPKGPTSLISGLNTHPLNLLLQSSAIAMYGVGRLLIPFPNRKRLWSVVRLTKGVSAIVFPILKAEGVTEIIMLPFQLTIVPQTLIKSALHLLQMHK